MSIIETITTILLFVVFAKLMFVTYRKFKAGYFSVAMPAIVVMFVFLCLPIILDVIFGKPDYSNYDGFYQALKSDPASIYYNLYICFVGILFLRYISKSKERQFSTDIKRISDKIYAKRYFFWIIMLIPFVAVYFSYNPSAYLDYKAVLIDRSIQFKDSHAIVGKTTLLSAIAGSVLIYFLSRGKSTSIIPKYIAYFLLLFAAFWIDGKRGIIVKYFFNLLISGWLLGVIKPKKLVLRGAIILMFLVGFIYMYGKEFGESLSRSRDVYSSLRVNLGRDHTIKFTLYREYVMDKPILEYRGESLLFDAFFFVPRSKWSGKPYPYAVYFVAAVLNRPPEPIGWSFTTCVLEEVISNIGFLGIFVAPLFLLWICKVGDRSRNTILKFISIIVVVFFLFTQLAAFLPIFIVFLFLFFRERAKRKKATRRFRPVLN